MAGTSLAVMSPEQTRSGEPASTALAWVIAALPPTLMALAMAVGWWPHPLVLVPQMLLVLAVAGWDSRRLDRELVDVSWLWALLTPATYLFVRATTTGRGYVAAWIGLITTAAWIVGVLVGAFIAVITSVPAPTYPWRQEQQAVSTATAEYQAAQTTWLQSPGNSGADGLQSAAGDLSVALDELRAQLLGEDFPDELADEVNNLSTTLSTLSTELGDIASAEGVFELERQQCEATIASYDNDKAVLGFLSSSGAPEAATVADFLPVSQASAQFCTFDLPLTNAVEVFVRSIRAAKSYASIRAAYDNFATDVSSATSDMRAQQWPAEMDAEMSAVISEYEAAASAASQVVKSFDQGDFREARESGHDMAQAMRAAGSATTSLSLKWNTYVEELRP